MAAERNPQVKKAVVTLRKLSADEQARDMDSLERFARTEGKAEECVIWQGVVANKDEEIARLRAALEKR